ncbi:hypothetical protein [Maribacter sp. 2210JD10-5]|uniref:hypothetical protein n=1 Tax=Maribacter sp. 2210JD10-5 TaxID=3386272 RepID=UPI0039BC4600
MVQEYKRLKRKWLLTGGFGAVSLGAGLSGSIESGFLKYSGADMWIWIGCGTLSLCVLVLGIILLIKAGLLSLKLNEKP